MDADEPWQALGCCMEIANALRSPDPAQYISHFPVHQVTLSQAPVVSFLFPVHPGHCLSHTP